METRECSFGDGVARRVILILTIPIFLFAGSLCCCVDTAAADDITVQINEGETRSNETGLQWKNGKLTVVNSGIVEATGPEVVHGVSVENGGLDVTNNENARITGKVNGVVTSGTSSGTRVENKTGATIEGGEFGVMFLDNGGTVENSGNIAGGVYSGVYSANETSVTNHKGGSIAGGETGVDVRAGSVTNSGAVTGGSYGVRALTVKNQAGGVIAGREGSGVRLTDGGTVTNGAGGSIAGDRNGITMNYGTVTNSGTVGEIKDDTGTTTAASKYGITIDNYSSDQTAKVTNAYESATGTGGKITGTRYGIRIGTGRADVTNQTKATITGGESGIYHGGTGTITNAGTITGQNTGVTFTGTGSIENTGLIEGKEESGVEILNSGASLKNKSGGAITGGTYGIMSQSDATITNAGTITGQQTGVALTATATATNTGVIEGKKKYGVEMKNSSASLTNKTGATVTGGEVGVYVGAGTFKVNAGTVTGGQYGVYYESANELSNTGTVAATKGTAVMFNGDGTVVNAGTMQGGSTASTTEGVAASGIKVTGKADITNSTGGSIAGADSGITMNYGTVTNTGTIGEIKDDKGTTTVASKYGIDVKNMYRDRVTEIVNAYDATGGHNPGDPKEPDDPTSEAAGKIAGTTYGIYVRGGSVDIVNETKATITGGESGIYHGATGTITNAGTITGQNTGVTFTGTGSIENMGLIEGNEESGVEILNSGASLKNKSGGIITGKQAGVTIVGGSITNTAGGSIAGADSGIAMNYGTVTNTGTIGEIKDSAGTTTVASKYGIMMSSSSSTETAKVTNAYDSATGSAGKITGTQHGIRMGSGKAEVVNSGMIEGSEDTGILVMEGVVEGRITNESGGGITGGIYGVVSQSDAAITNAGTITGQQTGVALTGAATATNTGVIEGKEKYGVEMNNSGASLTNDSRGTITGKDAGVKVAGGSVTNKTGGSITGGEVGVYVGAGTFKVNAGTVTGGQYGVYYESANELSNTGTVAATKGTAVMFNGDGTVVNAGTMQGGSTASTTEGVAASGIKVTGKADITNSTGGSIAGADSGITMNYGTVTNTGTIGEIKDDKGTTTVASKYGIAINNPSTDQTATVTNAYDSATGTGGKITGTHYGIYVGTGRADVTNQANAAITGGESGIYHEGTGKITNAGTITGGINGVVSESGATITNAGTITGVSGAGIHMTGGGTVLNNAGADIKGLTGILSEGDGADVIENFGSIEGTGGTAISTGAGDDKVLLRSGSAVTGHVNLGDGTGDYLLLEQAGRATGGITGAEAIEKTGMGTWIVDGDVKSGKKISVTGILRTNSTYTHEDGACLIVPVGDMGITGKISAKNAVLGKDGGVYVKLSKAKDTRYIHYFTEGSYTILETDEGVSGEFDRVIRVKDTSDHLTPWLIPSLSHTARNVNIDIRHLSFDRSQGGSGNGRYAGAQDENTGAVTGQSYPALVMSETQRSLGRCLDTVYDSAKNSHDRATILDNLMTTMDPETLVGSDKYLLALDQISGITHTAATATGAARQSSFYQNLFGGAAWLDGGTVRTGRSEADSPVRIAMDTSSVAIDASFLPTVNGRKNPFGMWLKGYMVTGNRNGDGIESRYDYTIQGVMGGMDYLFTPDLRAGLALGYSGVTVDMREVPDTNKQDSFQASVYASYVSRSRKWYLDGALSRSWNKYKTERHIDVGSLHRVANASYDGAEISGYLEGGRRLSVKGLEVTPLVSVLAMKGSTDGFTETDAGSANLTIDSNDTESLQSGVGLKVSRQFEVWPDFFLTPEMGARWFHEFGDTRTILNARFADAPSGSYVITSDTVDRDSGVISLNLQARRHDRLRFSLGYDLGFRRDQTSHAVTGWMRYNW